MRALRFAGLLLALAAGLCAAAPAAGAAVSAVSDEAAVPPDRPLIVLGVGGLRWSDINPTTSGHLFYSVANVSATAAMAVRTALPTSCPIDGWLTLNSGSRSVGPRPDGECLPVPTPEGTGPAARFPQWADLVAPNADYTYDPAWGTLAGQGSAWCAVGPGAALALAQDGGGLRGAQYRGAFPPGNLDGCTRTLIDGGTLPEGPGRKEAVRTLDRSVGDLLERVGDRGVLVVAGISDSAVGSPHLTAVMVADFERIDDSDPYLLRSPSTRQVGLIQITDLTPTLLGAAPPPGLPGAALSLHPHDSVGDLPDAFDVSAQTIRDGFVPFFGVLIAGQVLGLAVLARAYRRGAPRERVARRVRGLGLFFGAAPVATYLVSVVPWAEFPSAASALYWSGVGLGSAVLAGLAARFGRRAGDYGPAALIGGLTVAVLSVDVARSSTLALNSPLGLSPLVAGRFYGFGNIAFAVFAMSTLLLAAAVWGGLAERHRRGGAMLGLIAVGTVAVLVDGAPGLGTDFGGVLALAPGLAVLGLMLAGIRLSPVRLAAIAVGTIGAVAVLAVADWSRPDADRTHLGRFVQDVLDGNALDVVGRKADANLDLFTNPLIVIAAVPLVVAAVLAVAAPRVLRLHGLVRAQEADPVFRALLVAALTTALLGFAVNDSGIIVPAVALFTGAPLFIAVWAQRWAGIADMAAGSPPNQGVPRIESPVDGPGQ